MKNEFLEKNSALNLPSLRRRINQADNTLANRFWDNEYVDDLVHERAKFIDSFLAEIWQHWFEYNDDICLIAVGGYGRKELHPFSDIDLLILVRKQRLKNRSIESFVQLLWDLKLDIGHSVRTIRECLTEAKTDLSVITSLYEKRYLAGSRKLFEKLTKRVDNPRLWPSVEFFIAKKNEQLNRHKHHLDVDYDLEPNIKSSPGGLRDIQTISWITNRHLGTNENAELLSAGFLTNEEYQSIVEGKKFLWKVRFGLHLIADRKEDRLLFDYQRELAQRFGYRDSHKQLAVEQFMHVYYQKVLELREVNDILLQHFEEATTPSKRNRKIKPINERFQTRNDYLEIRDKQVFRNHPAALIEIFLILANHPILKGVRAGTIRAIREHLDLIDDRFRKDPEVNALFIQLLKSPHALVTQLTRMRRYGVLGKYIEEFGAVIGQMQHDLFHAYTVDAHTMMLIKHLRRFHYASSKKQFPVAHHAVNNVPKIELLYIAGIFHDIAKGRGGDHSALGSSDVLRFCNNHRIDQRDSELVAWLVDQHLVMSTTAQNTDITDPDVVLEFARNIKTEERLDYLYALTVADINATNPNLWNSWRASLLRQLYVETRKVLRRGLENPARRTDYVSRIKHTAYEKLAEMGHARQDVNAVWGTPGEEFFLHHSGIQVAKITSSIIEHEHKTDALTLTLDQSNRFGHEGGTEIFLYAKNREGIFYDSVSAIDQLELTIMNANISTSAGDHCFNSYIVLEKDGKPVQDRERTRKICAFLADAINKEVHKRKAPNRLVPTQLKQCATPTVVSIKNDKQNIESILRIIAADRPGLLALVGGLFIDLEVLVHQARITTLGENVEDIFHITDRNNQPIIKAEDISRITQTLSDKIDNEIKENVA